MYAATKMADLTNVVDRFYKIWEIENSVKSMQQNNRLFPSSLVPLFQRESKCKTILMKMALICMKMKLRAELISYERFCTYS